MWMGSIRMDMAVGIIIGIIINGKMVLCDTLSHVTAEMPLEDKFFEIYRETAGEIV